MRLPNAEHAVTEQEEITDYLLNWTHRLGARRANFFLRFGFRLDDWLQLADARFSVAFESIILSATSG